MTVHYKNNGKLRSGVCCTMNRLTEQGVIEAFIGKSVNPETFTKVAHNNRDQYLICNADYIDKPMYCELFGVTDRLKELWGYSGVDFSMYLTVEDGIITKAHMDKYRERAGGHGRPAITVLTTSQQELRVARRILQYITE